MCIIKALENRYSRAVLKVVLGALLGLAILGGVGLALGLGCSAYCIANSLVFTGSVSWVLLSPLWKIPVWLIVFGGWCTVPYVLWACNDRLGDYLDAILFKKRLNQKKRPKS